MFSEVLINVAALYDRTFTYKGSAEVGSLVKVPFGNRQAVGLVLNTLANTDQNDMEMKDIVGHLYDGEPILNLELLAIAREMAQFYLCPFGSAIEVMLPIPFSAKEVAGWKKGRTRDTGIGLADALVMKTPSVLTPDQVEAISEITRAIDTKKTIPFLLHGVTGSGKTEVYLRAISHVLSNYPDRQIIYLVPEIALTPSAIATLISRFGDSVGVLHSALSPGERMRTWRRIMAGDTRIIVGARSALFAPVGKLALIIIDEEHETSYRHEGGFYFHTRILAQLRAKKCGALVILGSATPSIEVYYNAIQGRARLLELRSRPAGSMLPDVSIVDMRSEIRSGNTGLLSRELQDAIQQCMNRGEQALLLFNRRGYAQFSLCQTCGYIPQCPLCDVSLHFHAETFSLKCHYCNYSTRYVRECSKCGGERMKNKGAGTEKLEEVLRSTFPDSKVTRIDADTTRFKGSHTRLLLEFSGSKGHILLGTRMIAKGLDFPLVTVVGVIDADSGLFFPEFRAVEESFHLLMQVSGRAGRGEHHGKVYIQSYNPDHYAIRFAQGQYYKKFYDVESRLRRKLAYPPFGGLIGINFRGADLMQVTSVSLRVAEIIRSAAPKVTILGPVSSHPEKVKNIFRRQLTLKGSSRTMLQESLRALWPEIKNICGISVHAYAVVY